MMPSGKRGYRVFIAKAQAMLGQAVYAVESGVVVNLQVAQADCVKKIVDLANFLNAVAVNGTVHGAFPFALENDANAARRVRKVILRGLVGAKPVADLGIKIRGQVCGAKVRLHGFPLRVGVCSTSLTATE